MKIGFFELVLVFVVALVIIGPDKLPSFAQRLGSALKEFRKASADVTKEVRENVIEPLEDAQRPIREAMEPLEELHRDVQRDFREVEQDFKRIGKASPKPTNLTADGKECSAEVVPVEVSLDEHVEAAEPNETPSVQTDENNGGDAI